VGLVGNKGLRVLATRVWRGVCPALGRKNDSPEVFCPQIPLDSELRMTRADFADVEQMAADLRGGR
jgi:hypothetical protein